ncbi:MAG: glycosyltransferase family 39 protein, partial [Chloroflexi bacterium]|nr:glycosyltransferase family 39 protein [Chloroflexota bacterium]
MGRKLLYLTVAVILGLMLRTMLAEAKSDSATMDEGVHLTAGYSYIQTQDNRLNPEHPPLVKDLAGLAVSTESFNFPIKWFKSHVIGQYDLGFKFMYHSGNDPDRILYLARLPIVAITVVLGLFVFLWSRELNGTAAGLFSLVLFAFDPNFIAHGHYVTHDVPLSAAIVINLYLVWRYLKNPTRLRWLLSGVSLGLALLTKFSAPLLFPAYLVILVYLAVKDGGVRTVGAPAAAGLETAKSTSAAEAKGPAVGLADKTRSIPSAFQGRNISRTLRRFWRYSLPFIGMAGVAAVLIYIVYGLNMMAMPVDVQYSIMWRMLPAPAPFLSFLGQTGLRPLSYFLMGLDIVKNHVADGQLIYFMGRITPGHILYYPVAFLVKSTLPTLFLVGVAIIFGRRVKSKNPLAEVALLSTMIIFLITVLLGKLDLGIRYILPFYALFYVYAGKFIKLVRVESFGRWIGGRFRPARSMLNG